MAPLVAVPEVPSPSELLELGMELWIGVIKVGEVAPNPVDESPPLVLDVPSIPELPDAHVKLGTMCPVESQF